MKSTQVAAVRGFNRAYTQRVGALSDSFLGSGRPLGAARLLYEIGPVAMPVADVRRRLELDSGYLSRLLRQLESEGLIALADDPADRRRRLINLTAEGKAAWQSLDECSDDLVVDLLEPLSENQRQRLVDAVTAADRLVRVATLRFSVADPMSESARSALQLYFGELNKRFSAGFDAGETEAWDLSSFSEPHGRFLLASNDGNAVACGGVTRHDHSTAEIKRMWVDSAWRGEGIGRRMLEALENTAREMGFGRVVLDTNSVLKEAIAMYATAGYHAIDRYNDNPYAFHWFAKPLE